MLLSSRAGPCPGLRLKDGYSRYAILIVNPMLFNSISLYGINDSITLQAARKAIRRDPTNVTLSNEQLIASLREFRFGPPQRPL